jgi:hypothetical protein
MRPVELTSRRLRDFVAAFVDLEALPRGRRLVPAAGGNRYKANWSTEPFVYITSRRYTTRPAAPATIKIYANLAAVELRVNGVSQGSWTSADHIFTWPNIVLQSA